MPARSLAYKCEMFPKSPLRFGRFTCKLGSFTRLLRTFGTSFAKPTPFAHRTGMSTEPPAEDLDSETLDDFPISEELDDAATVEEAAAASEDASAQLLLEEPPAETDEMQELVIQYGRAAKHVKMVFREAERAAKEADAAAAVATAERPRPPPSERRQTSFLLSSG